MASDKGADLESLTPPVGVNEELDVSKVMDSFAKKLSLVDKEEKVSLPPTPSSMELSLEGIAKGIKDGRFKNVMFMTGAGISVSAGIPDFRTPGTGLYSQLEKYELDEPSDIFTLDFFRKNPDPFNLLTKEMFPGKFKPTLAHYFIRLFEEKNLLLRDYTQNIDTLERIAGISGDKLVEAHGSYSDSRCIDCTEKFSITLVKDAVMKDETPRCPKCKGLVKPTIVFFGENLPKRFFQIQRDDLAKCDLLIVMGTSLTVYPFAKLKDDVSSTCVRLLINREAVGVCNSTSSFIAMMQGRRDNGFLFDDPKNTRDVKWLGDIDAGVSEFAELLGWTEELNKLVAEPLNHLS